MEGVDLDRVESFASVDPDGMLALVEGFQDQCRRAIEVGKRAPLPARRDFRSIVLAGMGGSAIGGDLLRTCLAGELNVPWVVNRDYGLPKWVGTETLLLAASYSGDTEETLAAFEEGLARGATVFCLASGGTLGARAQELGLPLAEIPSGLPPRAALGYSFFPLAVVLGRLGLAPVRGTEMEEALTAIGRASERWGRDRPVAQNAAKGLAERLVGRLPVVYAGEGLLSSVAVRWKGQLNENSKELSYYALFPELNHNEVEGWRGVGPLGRNIHLILLRDREDSPRVQHRMEITADIIGERAGEITELWSEGAGRMARMFSLVCLGDFVSVYLALRSGRDPTPVENIGRLKRALASLEP